MFADPIFEWMMTCHWWQSNTTIRTFSVIILTGKRGPHYPPEEQRAGIGNQTLRRANNLFPVDKAIDDGVGGCGWMNVGIVGRLLVMKWNSLEAMVSDFTLGLISGSSGRLVCIYRPRRWWPENVFSFDLFRDVSCSGRIDIEIVIKNGHCEGWRDLI